MHSYGTVAYIYGSDPRGSAKCLAKFAMKEKPKRFREAEPAGKANDDGSAYPNQGCQATSSLIDVRNTIQPGKVRKCAVEQCSAIPSRVDQSFRGITGDKGDVQQCKKKRVFLISAIEHQDFIAGQKGVSKHLPYGCALGTDPWTGKKVVIPPSEIVKSHDWRILRVEVVVSFHVRAPGRDITTPSISSLSGHLGFINYHKSLRSLQLIHTVIRLLHRRSVLLRVFSELEPQLPRGPEKSHLDRSFRGIENFAHTPQLKTLEMPQVKNHALARCKFSQSP
jgi:hypothetical protein